MASTHLPNYLLAHRKRLALIQDDVAYLLGVTSAAKPSRYERFARVPGLETALAYEAIFGRQVSELFAGQYAKVHRKIAARAKRLERSVARQPVTEHTARKLQTLQEIIVRVAKKPR